MRIIDQLNRCEGGGARVESTLRRALCAVTAAAAAFSAQAAEESVREVVLPSVQVESEPRPEFGFDPPPDAYPILPVDQEVTHGVRQGFVTTTTGGLVFKVVDMRLPGRMPIEIGRVYDSKISDSLPPPAPGKGSESVFTADFGDSWIFSYSSYLVSTGYGFLMATPDGDLIDWVSQPEGYYLPDPNVAGPFILLKSDPFYGTLVATHRDGTRWIYTPGVASRVAYGLTRIEDRSGNYIAITYNSDRQISQVSNSDGASVTLTRTPYYTGVPGVLVLRVTKITDHTGREVDYTFNAQFLLGSATDALDHTWTYEYDAWNKLTVATDPLANDFLTATYDSQHRVQQYEANTGPWSLTYGSAAVHRTIFTNGLGDDWEYHYDESTGITVEIHEPTGGVHQVTLDTANDPIAYLGPEGATASWTYDLDHRVTTHTAPGVTDPITYVYDPDDHWIDSVTSAAGGVTSFVRDTAGRVTEEHRPDGGVQTATYASNGDRLTTRLPKGNAAGGVGYLWSFTYDSYGNVTTATDPTGRVFQIDYTPYGDLWKIRRPDHEDQGQTVYAEWIYDRDLRGRLTTSTDPLGHTWTRTYDVAGRLTTVVGPEGTQLTYGYDARYRLTSITVENGLEDMTTSLTYDDAGTIATKLMPSGAEWSYGYDESSRLVEIRDPENRTWSFTRNLAGKIATKIFPGGQQVMMSRDTAGRLVSRTYPGGRVETFTYDEAGRLAIADADEGAAWRGALIWTYDNMGRPGSIRTEIDEPQGLVSKDLVFEYDLNGNRSTLNVNPFFGESVDYVYDELDRVVTADSSFYGLWSVEYDLISGHRTRVEYANRSEAWEYDLAGRVIAHDWDWPGKDSGAVSMTYDDEDRVVWSHDTVANETRSTVFGLSGLPVEVQTTTAGEVTTKTYLHDLDSRPNTATEQVTGGDPIDLVFDWDAAGRLVYARRGDTVRVFNWNDAPTDDPAVALRVWRTTENLSESPLEIEFGFDGNLRRVRALEAEQQDPALVAEYRWAAVDNAIALRANERVDEDTYNLRKMAVEVGGYYAKLHDSGSMTGLTSPIQSVANAAAALRPSFGSELADVSRTFGRGDLAGGPFASRLSLSNMDGVSGLSRHASLLNHLLVSEQRPKVNLATDDRVELTPRSFFEEWTAAALSRKTPDRDQGVQVATTVPNAASSPSDISVLGIAGPDGEDSDVSAFNCAPVVEIAEGAAPECPSWYLRRLGSGGGICAYQFDYTGRYGYHPQTGRGGDHLSEGGVSLANGEFILGTTDLAVFDASGGLEFSRTYRSGLSYDGDLGHKWRHNWNEFIALGSDPEWEQCGYLARWVRRDGSYQDFFINTEGVIENPENSVYRLREAGGAPFDYEIRNVNGTIRRFTARGDVFMLEEMQSGSHLLMLEYDAANRIERVRANGVSRLEFLYLNNRLQRVQSGIDPDNEWVEFTYSECGELESVTKPLTELGFDKNGVQVAPQQPSVTYHYENLNADDCLIKASGHLLTKAETQQYNPLTAESRTETLIQNIYLTDPSSPDSVWNHLKVHGQCFGHEVCGSGGCTPKACDDSATADIGYAYTRDVTAIPVLDTTTTIDRRVAGREIEEDNEYSVGKLVAIVEDAGDSGLQRRTSFQYNVLGLVWKTTFADGTCEQTEYEEVSGVMLPKITRFRTAARCVGGTDTVPDQVMVRTFEPFNGALRTVTRSEAFPDGNIPSEFDPYADPWRAYTYFFDYDFDEGYPTELVDLCQEWGITAPTVQGDLNDFTTDDQNFLGLGVRVRRWVPGDGNRPAGYLTETVSYLPDGRPYESVDAQGVRTRSTYYASGTGLWDWRAGHVIAGDGVAGLGPLAQTIVSSSDGTEELVTLHAWSNRPGLIATQDYRGVILERTFSSAGLKLGETIRCVPGGDCELGSDTLSTMQYSYDLRGRAVRAAVLDGAGSSVEYVAWATHDDQDRILSLTVDPNPAVAPGESYTGTDHLHQLKRVYRDGRGRITTTVSPAGRVLCQSFDNLNRLTHATRKATLDGGESACESLTSEDITSIVEYDAMDRPVIITDGESHNTYNWYDALGRKQYVSDGKPMAPAQVFEGMVFLGSPPNLPTTSQWHEEVTYDSENRPIRSRFFGRDDTASLDPESGYLRIGWTEYDPLGRVATSSVGVSNGFIPVAAADSLEFPSEPIAGLEVATNQSKYDSLGRRARTIDALGFETDYHYDSMGRQNLTLLPEINGYRDSIDRVFNALGQLSDTTTTTFSPAGTAHETTIRRAYDPWGRVSRTVGSPDNEDLIETREYDELGRIRTTVRRWMVEPTYQGLGPDDQATEVIYDGAGRVQKTRQRIDSDGGDTWAESYNVYDGDGLLIQLTDAEGNVTDYEYDSLGRLRRMLYPLHDGKRQTIEYVDYDNNGNLTRVEYREDDSDTVPRVTWTMHYDDQGRLASREAVVENTQGTGINFFGTTTQSYDYDDLGRMIRSIDSSPEAFPEEANIVVEYTVDTAGRTLQENHIFPLNGGSAPHVVDSMYELDGFRKELLYPEIFDGSGQPLTRYRLSYIPDAMGRLSEIHGPRDPANPASVQQVMSRYDFVGARTWQREYVPNQTAVRYFELNGGGEEESLYDGLGRPTGFATVDLTGTLPPIVDYRMGYDRAGNASFEQRRHEPVGAPATTYQTRAVSYDLGSRLKTWHEGALPPDPIDPSNPDPAGEVTAITDAEVWSLDLVGNWATYRSGTELALPDTYQANELNQYTEIVPAVVGEPILSFAYDWLGQMRENEARNQKYVWDAFGRLTEIRNRATDSLIARYRYDAGNRRVEKYAPGGNPATDLTTRYIYDGWRVIEERAVVDDGMGQDEEVVRARYGYGVGLDELLWMDRDVAVDAQGDPDPIWGSTSGTIGSRFFLHHDMRGSIVALTNDPTTSLDPLEVVERYSYSAHGDVSVWWNPAWDGAGYAGPAAGLSKVGLTFFFTGQRFDTESGLYYFKNRYLDSAIGRFLSRDQLGYADGLNVYRYARANPLQNVDALGLYTGLPNDLTCVGFSVEYRDCQAALDAIDRKAKESGPRWSRWSQWDMNLALSLGYEFYWRLATDAERQQWVDERTTDGPESKDEDPKPDAPQEKVEVTSTPLDLWVLDVLVTARVSVQRSRSRTGRTNVDWWLPDVSTLEVATDEIIVDPPDRMDPQPPSVEICSGPVDLPFPANLFNHRWLRTPWVEAGLGPAGGGYPAEAPINSGDIPYIGRTAINDHSGRGNLATSECHPQRGVDARCVSNHLEIGKPMGRWAGWNNCWTVTRDIVDQCRTGSRFSGLPSGCRGHHE